jgi:DNA-binding CsgD family transcriptional regulator
MTTRGCTASGKAAAERNHDQEALGGTPRQHRTGPAGPVLAERESELGYLAELLAGDSGGRARAALVGGPPGSGKTALLRAFSEQAIDAGAVVLTAVCSAEEPAVPLGVVGQLFRGAQQTRSRADPGQADRLAELRAFPRRFPEAGPPQMSVLDRIGAVLEELAFVDPVVVEIDDVHYADDASLACLRYLLRRLWRARVLVVLTESEYERQVSPSLSVELLRLPEFRRLKLAPLSPAGVERVLARDLGPERARAARAAYSAVTGGNPLLVRALLDDHTRAAPDAAEPVAGQSYAHAVLAVLHSGPEDVRAVARSLAVLGTGSTPETVRQVLGADGETVEKALARLVASGLVDPRLAGPFRHEQARAAVLADLSPTARVRWHGSVAALLHESGAPASEIAPHLLAGGHLAGARAAEILRIAAGQALDDDQPERAVACLRRAEGVADGEDERLAVTALLLRAEWRLDPARAAPHADPLLAAVRAGRLPWRDAAFLVKALLWHGRSAEAAEVLKVVARGSRQNTDAELAVLWDWVATCHPEVLDRAHRRPKPAAMRTRSRLSLRAQSAALLSTVLTTGGDAETAGHAEQVLRSVEVDHRLLESSEAALLTLVYAHRPDRAAWWCDHLLGQSAAQHSPTWLATLSAIRAQAAVRQGDLPAAKKHGRAALTALKPDSWGVALGAPVAALVFAATGMGRYAEAATLLSRPMPEAALRTRYGLHYLHARGQHHFATGRFRAAAKDFLACGELMARWGVDVPALVPWRSAAAEVLLWLGKPDQARQLADEQLQWAGGPQSRGRGLALRVLAKMAEPGARPALLQRAVTDLRSSGDQLELAHALADLASAHQELGDGEPARAFATQARRLAEECRAEPLRASVVETFGSDGEALRRIDTPIRGAVASLSPAEFRVAALAAHGYTNRKIAGKLRITASTVEQHLTRVYRKLQVTKRADLPVSLLNLTHDADLAL